MAINIAPPSAETASNYHDDQMLVTFRSQAVSTFGRVAAEMSRGVVSNVVTEALESASADAESHAVSDTSADAVVLTANVAVEAMVEMERSGLIRDAVALREPSSENLASASIPLGAGRTLAAAAEAFGEEMRPSDRYLNNTVLLSVDRDQWEYVAARLTEDADRVAFVERVPRRYLLQTLPAETQLAIAPWHLARIKLDRARAEAGFDDGSSATVAVLDTGIDEDHPLLAGMIDGYSYAPPQPQVNSGRRDIIAHGTHVAGTIAADGAAGDIEGVSRARLHIYKIFDDDVDAVDFFVANDGRTYAADIRYVNHVMYLRALAACVDRNHDVVNLSIGGPGIGDSQEQGLFRTLVDQGQIVVAAMGNERREGSPTSWPAKYDGVVAVGALDVNDGVSAFSNLGDHIWISAPGNDIFATMPTYRGVDLWTTKLDSNGRRMRDQPIHWTVYRSTMSGTSMATPQVAAAAALWTAKNGRDAAAFREALKDSARKLSSMSGRDWTPDHGWGCLDLEKLL